jgi:hypothetical protein
VGIKHVAHRHRIAYSAANFLANRGLSQTQRLCKWSILSTVAAAMGAVATCSLAATVALIVLVPEARKKAGILGTVLLSEVGSSFQPSCTGFFLPLPSQCLRDRAPHLCSCGNMCTSVHTSVMRSKRRRYPWQQLQILETLHSRVT